MKDIFDIRVTSFCHKHITFMSESLMLLRRERIPCSQADVNRSQGNENVKQFSERVDG